MADMTVDLAPTPTVLDFTAAAAAPLARLGGRLGFYRALAERPYTAAELAAVTGTVPALVREWLRAQEAAEIVAYDPGSARYVLPQANAMVFAHAGSPIALIGSPCPRTVGLDGVAAAFRDREARANGGEASLSCTIARAVEAFYARQLTTAWLPAMRGMSERLNHGARVAEVGCGRGLGTILLARAYPTATFLGTDADPVAIAGARCRALSAELDERVQFEVAPATRFDNPGFDLIAFFRTLEPGEDAVAAARAARQALAPGGRVMVVAPTLGDTLEESVNAIGRLYYGDRLQTTEGAGPRVADGRLDALAEVLDDAGFRTFNLVAWTAFDTVVEARP